MTVSTKKDLSTFWWRHQDPSDSPRWLCDAFAQHCNQHALPGVGCSELHTYTHMMKNMWKAIFIERKRTNFFLTPSPRIAVETVQHMLLGLLSCIIIDVKQHNNENSVIEGKTFITQYTMWSNQNGSTYLMFLSLFKRNRPKILTANTYIKERYIQLQIWKYISHQRSYNIKIAVFLKNTQNFSPPFLNVKRFIMFINKEKKSVLSLFKKYHTNISANVSVVITNKCTYLS